MDPLTVDSTLRSKSEVNHPDPQKDEGVDERKCVSFLNTNDIHGQRMSAEMKGAPTQSESVFGPTTRRAFSGMTPKSAHHVFYSKGKIVSGTEGDWRKRATGARGNDTAQGSMFGLASNAPALQQSRAHIPLSPHSGGLTQERWRRCPERRTFTPGQFQHAGQRTEKRP